MFFPPQYRNKFNNEQLFAGFIRTSSTSEVGLSRGSAQAVQPKFFPYRPRFYTSVVLKKTVHCPASDINAKTQRVQQNSMATLFDCLFFFRRLFDSARNFRKLKGGKHQENVEKHVINLYRIFLRMYFFFKEKMLISKLRIFRAKRCAIIRYYNWLFLINFNVQN